MKKFRFIMFLAFYGMAAAAQDTQSTDVFNGEKYQTFRNYYIERIDTGIDQKMQAALRDFKEKVRLENTFTTLEHKNFLKVEEIPVEEYERWLEENLHKTKFATLLEARESLHHCLSLLKEAREQSKKMTPLFNELSKEIGYSALFKRLSADYDAYRAQL